MPKCKLATSTMVNKGLGIASSENDALSKAKSLIIIVGKGKISNDALVAIPLIIPIHALNSTNRYWEVGDAYNGTGFLHFQVKATSSFIESPSLYYNANIITDASYEYYYL